MLAQFDHGTLLSLVFIMLGGLVATAILSVSCVLCTSCNPCQENVKEEDISTEEPIPNIVGKHAIVQSDAVIEKNVKKITKKQEYRKKRNRNIPLATLDDFGVHAQVHKTKISECSIQDKSFSKKPEIPKNIVDKSSKIKNEQDGSKFGEKSFKYEEERKSKHGYVKTGSPKDSSFHSDSWRQTSAFAKQLEKKSSIEAMLNRQESCQIDQVYESKTEVDAFNAIPMDEEGKITESVIEAKKSKNEEQCEFEKDESPISKGKKKKKNRTNGKSNLKPTSRNSLSESQIHFKTIQADLSEGHSSGMGEKSRSSDCKSRLESKSIVDFKNEKTTNETKKEAIHKEVAKDGTGAEDINNQKESERTASGQKRKIQEMDLQKKKKKLSAEEKFKPYLLMNLGNTCYFNSALQALYQTRILGHFLRDFDVKHSAKGSPLLHSMLKFYFNGPNPQEILQNVRQSSKRFLGYKQEDSHELIRHLCQGLAKEEKKLHKDAMTAVDKVFKGHVLRLYHCLKCRQDYHLVEQFYDLSLAISFPLNYESFQDQDLTWLTEHESPLGSLITRKLPPKIKSSQIRSVEACLKYYTRVWAAPYFCQCFQGDPEIDDLPLAYDRSLLIDLPPVLVIHLQRFEQLNFGGFVKCTVPVRYPKILDMAPYTIQYNKQNKKENIYDLYAVVEHSGSMECGHYIACIKTRTDTTERLEKFINSKSFNKDGVTKNWIIEEMKGNDSSSPTGELQSEEGQWYYASDSYVRKITEKEAFDREAILLFYEKL